MRLWEKQKRALALLLAVLLLAATGSAASGYPFTGEINAETNMRSTPNSSVSNVIMRVGEGEVVKVTGASGNFYRIEYDGRTGYVFKKYVEETTAPTGSGVTSSGYPYMTVTTDDVNLRAAASTSAKRLLTIREGESVSVLQLSGSWVNVTYNGQTGWVHKDYVRLATISAATAAPVTANPLESTSSYQLLQSGADGDQVMALQEALQELGYLKGEADGVYGAATAQAVMAFQRANEYPVTGYADANLQAFLFNGKPLNAQGQKTKVKTLPMLEGINVSSGDKGLLVRTIQSQLIAKGYLTGSVTGAYDNATVKAVKAFQKKNGLTADGVCGAKTQELLMGSGVSANATATPSPSPTPTALPAFEKPESTVRSGSTGRDARLVQQRLIDLGYLNDRADGDFGSKSVAALKAFQQKNGLKADGVCGSGTSAVLFSWLALSADYIPLATPVPTAEVSTTWAPITKENVVLVKQGVTGSAVLRLQNRLTELGYYQSAEDSVCKADDVAAIRAFQRMNGLTVDGIAGYDTQVLLYSDNAIMDNGLMAGSLQASYTTLKKGDRGDAVKALQQRLIQLGFLTGEADGIYGTDTAEAVYNFQKRNGLTRDGVAGEKTLKALYSTTANGPAPTATPAPTQALATIETALVRQGDKGDAVVALQQRLIALGYLSGTADGVFGVKTYQAVKEFQLANALSADGIAGKQTIAALNKAGSDSSSAPVVTTSPDASIDLGTTVKVSAENVVYEYWYSTVRSVCRQYQYATVYDPETGISWQVHMFSFGKHAEAEPLTAADTARMEEAFGGNTWTPKPVWVIFADGTIRIATTHSMPHEVQHITDNNFPGHTCIHFPRTMAQVTAIGPYATKHQKTVDEAWAELQASLK